MQINCSLTRVHQSNGQNVLTGFQRKNNRRSTSMFHLSRAAFQVSTYMITDSAILDTSNCTSHYTAFKKRTMMPNIDFAPSVTQLSSYASIGYCAQQIAAPLVQVGNPDRPSVCLEPTTALPPCQTLVTLQATLAQNTPLCKGASFCFGNIRV
jgi:hypothetical protein